MLLPVQFRLNCLSNVHRRTQADTNKLVQNLIHFSTGRNIEAVFQSSSRLLKTAEQGALATPASQAIVETNCSACGLLSKRTRNCTTKS